MFNNFGYFEGPIIIGHEKEFSPKKLVEIVRDSGKTAIEVYVRSKPKLEEYFKSIGRINQLHSKIKILQKGVSEKEHRAREVMQSLYSKLTN